MRVFRLLWRITKWLFATLVVLLIIIIGIVAYSFWKQDQWTPDRVSRITGVEIPKYKIIEDNAGDIGFNDDYSDQLILEFKTIPSEELFDEIDRIISDGNADWKRDGKKYFFSKVWGNGLPAPRGENENDDLFLNLSITRGEKVGTISYGAW